MGRLAVACAAVLSAASGAQADTHIAPTAAAMSGGAGAYTTLMNAEARSHQTVIGVSHMPGVAPGQALRITGIQYRLASWRAEPYPSWPPAPVRFANFDITLSRSLNAAGLPGQGGGLSGTYTENIGPDAVKVRAGELHLSAGAFPGGAVSPNFNPWGPLIDFGDAYFYTGGDLLITVRHTGSGIDGVSLDWVGGEGCQAIGVSSYTQVSGWYSQGYIGALACRLSYTIVPGPGVLGVGVVAIGLGRRRRGGGGDFEGGEACCGGVMSRE